MTARTVALRFHGVPGSQAGLAHSGRHVLIADRPEGVAGGQGLGFNGAELLSAALGECFWNDLHHAAAAQGCTLSRVEVAVETTLSGTPLRVTAATIRARAEADGRTRPARASRQPAATPRSPALCRELSRSGSS